jgi:hypothetical protein
MSLSTFSTAFDTNGASTGPRIPETLVTGATALQLSGVDVGRSSPLHFCTASTFQTRRSDVRVSRVRGLPERCGILVAPESALVAAAPDFDLVELVTAGDWLIRLKRCRLEKLRATSAAATGRGCRSARRAGELIRIGVDSPQESRLRMLLVLCRLPEPTGNPLLGTGTARSDVSTRHQAIHDHCRVRR